MGYYLIMRYHSSRFLTDPSAPSLAAPSPRNPRLKPSMHIVYGGQHCRDLAAGSRFTPPKENDRCAASPRSLCSQPRPLSPRSALQPWPAALRRRRATPRSPYPRKPRAALAAQPAPPPRSTDYRAVQQRLAQGWNTWDTHSVTTQVLLPEGLAIHVGLKHNTTLAADAFLRDPLIGRLQPGAEQVTPGPHAWDGSYTDLRISWEGHRWRIQSAHDAGNPDAGDLVLLAAPLPSTPISALPPTLIVSVDFLWNRPGTTVRRAGFIETHGAFRSPSPSTAPAPHPRPPSPAQTSDYADAPVSAPYFSIDFTAPVGVSTGRRRTLAEIQSIVERQRQAYQQSIAQPGTPSSAAPIRDAIETTLGWDTIYDPDHDRVISPVSRLWSVNWGGYVLFDWDTFFAATLASIGDRDLAYANALEILREETPEGFVPNYARPGGWKSFDRSEPPVGAITVLGLYRQFHDRWFLEDAFEPLLRWNRWWDQHRQTQGYLAWGSDGDTHPANLDDHSRGTRQGAILESGLDNSPMYDDTVYNPQSHLLEFADVGLMSLYIADCDALAQIADVLAKPGEAKELRARSARYRASLATLWSQPDSAFLNKDLHTGQFSPPPLAHQLLSPAGPRRHARPGPGHDPEASRSILANSGASGSFPPSPATIPPSPIRITGAAASGDP